MVPTPSHTTQQNIEDVYGEMGRVWLTELPEMLARICANWGLQIDALLGGNYAVVYLVRDVNHRLKVLKVGVPAREIEREWRTLKAFGGRGCVALEAVDPGCAALLLERIAPGRAATELTDDAAVPVVCDLMRRLHLAPLDDVAPDVDELADGFTRLRRAHDGGTGRFDDAVVRAAENTFREVLPGMQRVMLHGDLHHGNILSTPSGWVSIDPHGVRGPAQWEAGAWLRNPFERLRAEPRLAPRLDRRVDKLCEHMGWDRPLVRRLAAAQAVLSAVWSWEDHGTPDPTALRIAAALGR